jgi:hypothetical protein
MRVGVFTPMLSQLPLAVLKKLAGLRRVLHPRRRTGLAEPVRWKGVKRYHGAESMVMVVMGLSGSGKTAVGKALAARFNWGFEDADD